MKLKRESSEEVLSLLGEGVELQGELSFAHGLLVDGVVRGRIRSDSCIIIGPKGRVEAEMGIRRVSIEGEFHGTIHASERVEIHNEGKVCGDIFTPCLIIEAGALFEGKCNMNDQQSIPAGAETNEEQSAGQAGGPKRD